MTTASIPQPDTGSEKSKFPKLEQEFPVMHWNEVLEMVANKPGLTIAEIGAEVPLKEYLEDIHPDYIRKYGIDSVYLQNTLGANLIAVNKYPQQLEPLKDYGIERRLIADQEKLPLSGQSVDVAFSANTLSMADDVSRAIKELARIIKPDGKVIISADYFEESDDIEEDLKYKQLLRTINNCGLEIVRQQVVNIPEKHWRDSVRMNNPYVIIEATPALTQKA